MTDPKEAGTIVAADAIIIITEWNNKIKKEGLYHKSWSASLFY